MKRINSKVILAIGPASVILSYLSQNDQQTLNLLCRRAYKVVIPATKSLMNISASKDWGDWLDCWTYNIGSNHNDSDEWVDMDELVELDLWRGAFNVTISGEIGTYYGKWKEVKNRRVPHGRGVFICKEHYMFGFLENG